jgi:hypothetical protein
MTCGAREMGDCVCLERRSSTIPAINVIAQLRSIFDRTSRQTIVLNSSNKVLRTYVHKEIRPRSQEAGSAVREMDDAVSASLELRGTGLTPGDRIPDMGPNFPRAIHTLHEIFPCVRSI